MKRAFLLLVLMLAVCSTGFAQYVVIDNQNMVSGDHYGLSLAPHLYPAHIYLVIDNTNITEDNLDQWYNTVTLDGVVVAQIHLTSAIAPGFHDRDVYFPWVRWYRRGTIDHYWQGTGGGTTDMYTAMY